MGDQQSNGQEQERNLSLVALRSREVTKHGHNSRSAAAPLTATAARASTAIDVFFRPHTLVKSSPENSLPDTLTDADDFHPFHHSTRLRIIVGKALVCGQWINFRKTSVPGEARCRAGRWSRGGRCVEPIRDVKAHRGRIAFPQACLLWRGRMQSRLTPRLKPSLRALTTHEAVPHQGLRTLCTHVSNSLPASCSVYEKDKDDAPNTHYSAEHAPRIRLVHGRSAGVNNASSLPMELLRQGLVQLYRGLLPWSIPSAEPHVSHGCV